MALTIGNIGIYEESEDFETYVDRVEFFFDANSIDNAKKVSTFLSIVGPQVYRLTQDLMSPKKLKECTYAEIIKALKSHFKPKVIVVYERFKFYKRSQGINESITEFAAGLKACAHTCAFGNALNEQLRDRLICGMRSEATQRALLSEADLTYARALEIAIAREAAARDGQAMSHPQHGAHFVQSSHSSKSAPDTNFKSNNKPNNPCAGCGGNHWRKECPYINSTCHSCNKKGHLQKCCYASKSKPKTNKNSSFRNPKSRQTNYVDHTHATVPQLPNATARATYDDFIFTNESTTISTNPILLTARLANIDVQVEIDTGASRSVLSSSLYNSLWSKSKRPKLLPPTQQLRVWGGKQLSILGEIKVLTEICATKVYSKPKLASFVVVEGHGPILFGRDNLANYNMLPKFSNVNHAESDNFSNELAKQFQNLFSDGLGCYKDYLVSFDIDQSEQPKYCKARTVPYAMKPRLDVALDNLVSDGIISPISYSKWAAPVVPVVKPDGTIRVCGDYKITANKAIRLDTYPIPKPEDLFSSLSGGKIFSKLDMSQAYCQLQLEEPAKDLTVINTHRGLFKYNRLCFGISAAPGIFQRAMEQLIQGIPGVLCYLDDILVCGANEAEHKARLQSVLSKLEDAGLKLKLSKCSFKVPEVSYLGYRIDASGLHPTKDKVKAIVEAPEPKNLKQLESYLGVFNFYRRFVPNASSTLEPLNRLRKSGVSWHWNKEQQSAFKKSKDLLLQSPALVHFDPKIPISVVADSSSYGLGAVLSHIVDGQERPVCFASRTLLPAERNYPQVEREALAIVFALKHFHNYLWGLPKFRVVTDHKPLLGLFTSNKPISALASGRIQRWALMLQAYSFDLVHRSGIILGTADALSRLPLESTNESVPIPGEWTNLVNFLDSAPVTARTIREHTRTDPQLSKVLRYCELGWPLSLPETDQSLLSYFRKRNELSTEAGCLLWGSRVVIPERDRSALVSELHGGHVGASRMKELARSYLWWPSIDNELEELVRSCPKCLETRKAPPKAELHPWEWPSQPWHRIHVDYAGPVQNKYFLVIVDAFSKWVEIFPTNGPSTKETVKHLRHLFCQLGIPVTIVSDNGTCFTSQEFKDFVNNNGIRHVTSAVYKPSTNGLAERMVQTFKSALHSSKEHYSTLLDKFLFKYRITPHTSTGVSPAELLYRRKLRCRLDLLHPADMVGHKVNASQETQKRHYSQHPRHLQLQPGTPVLVRNYSTHGPKWSPGNVTEQHGPVSYRCQLENGKDVKRHQDQVILGKPNSALLEGSPETSSHVVTPICTPVIIPEVSPTVSTPVSTPVNLPMRAGPQTPLAADVPVSARIASPASEVSVQPQEPVATLRRSARNIRPPKRLNL